MTDTPLVSLPEGIGALSNLATLSLSGGTYRQTPSSLGGLKALKELRIGSPPHLEKLPAELGRLANLERLEINYCPELKSLPPLNGLSALKVLILHQCPKLKTLPDDLGDLEHLHTLDVRSCSGLKELPESLCQLSQDCSVLVPDRLKEQWAELRASKLVQPSWFW